jgi:16S rRNA (cytosine967-C5)-methyltransferase
VSRKPPVRATPLTHAADLLATVLAGMIPADRQMDFYFRAHRTLGARDRGFVAETVYGCLRRLRLLRHLTGESAPAPDLIAAYLLSVQDWSAQRLREAGYTDDAPGLAARVRDLDVATLPFAVRASLPDWLATRLVEQYGPETEALAQALNEPAPVDLRVNTLKADRDAVQTSLRAEGYDTTPTPYAPAGLRRIERAPLFATASFKAGLFEVQDEGSQLIAMMLEPKRRERVVDFCAGGGGKTLHIGALMANSGTIYAFDVAAKRLERLRPRLARAGVDNVRVQVLESERDTRLLRLRGKIDRVLVDAPCSGTGTLRRNPDIKWRTFDLAALGREQRRILAAAAQLVRPGGRLVYATCSLLPEENEAVTADFLATHAGFGAIAANDILARRHVPLTMKDEALRLDPLHHGTDGFFALALERLA